MNAAVFVITALTVIAVGWHVIATILIFENLRRRGEKVSFIWLRLMSPWYASKYRTMTRAETGRTGPLFYHWVIAINAALVFVLSGLAVRYL